MPSCLPRPGAIERQMIQQTLEAKSYESLGDLNRLFTTDEQHRATLAPARSARVDVTDSPTHRGRPPSGSGQPHRGQSQNARYRDGCLLAVVYGPAAKSQAGMGTHEHTLSVRGARRVRIGQGTRPLSRPACSHLSGGGLTHLCPSTCTRAGTGTCGQTGAAHPNFPLQGATRGYHPL